MTHPRGSAYSSGMNPISGGVIPKAGIASFMFYRGPQDGYSHWHRGIDIAAPLGTPVKAAEGGIVTHAVNSYTPGFRGYGKVVVIKSARGKYYLYGHLNRILVKAGDYIGTGKQIGEVGYTAYTEKNPTGNLPNLAPHLHLEVADSPYPMDREATRLDPVKQLALLAASAASGILLVIGIAWWLLRKKR